jgi:diguanylate cyclase (GGDEF)-like protein
MTHLHLHPHSTLLLVTESPALHLFFKNALETLDHYTLFYSDSPARAFDSLHQVLIHFIVIDETLGETDLADLCLKIRQLKQYQYTPILVLTSQLKKSAIRRLLKAGATDFLREPLEEEELFHRMEMALEMKTTRQKIAGLTSHFCDEPCENMSLKGRAILDDRAVKMISQALEEKTDLSMILLDLDQYKSLEGKRGDKEAKALLADFGAYLHSLMRGQDLLFSQGHGKFVILLPKTSPRASQFIAENIRESLEMTPFHTGGIPLHLTLSMGLVSLNQDKTNTESVSLNFDRLIRIGNQCLEKAKAKGGHTIVVHSPKGGSTP